MPMVFRLLCAGNYCPKSWMGTLLEQRAGYSLEKESWIPLPCPWIKPVVLREPAANGNPRSERYAHIICLAVRSEKVSSRRVLNDWCTVDFVVAIVRFGERKCPYKIHYLNMDFHRYLQTYIYSRRRLIFFIEKKHFWCDLEVKHTNHVEQISHLASYHLTSAKDPDVISVLP